MIKSQGLQVKHWGRRLQPLAENVNGFLKLCNKQWLKSMVNGLKMKWSQNARIFADTFDVDFRYLGLIINDSEQQNCNEEIMKYAQTAFDKSGQMKSLVEDLFDYAVHQVSNFIGHR